MEKNPHLWTQVCVCVRGDMSLTWDSLTLLEVCAGVVALGVVLKHQQAFGPQLQRQGAFQSRLQPDITQAHGVGILEHCWHIQLLML